jgi:acrylyl-CoA reductase (NADPH)
MVPDQFQAFWVTKTEDGQFLRQIVERSLTDLPTGEVLIQVQYSSLNYKDALSATGNPGVTKMFPHIPGVDAVGKVVNSTVPTFKVGDRVIVTGFDLGMNTWGGFAEYIRVPASWVLPLPKTLSLQDSMIYGTAGLTAALCIDALRQHGVQPDSGEVLVTGATGGVGSLVVAILAKLGFPVVAVTGKPEHHEFLRSLGATTILTREAVRDQSPKPLLSGRWAGVIDTVGGNILATALKSTRYGGCVAACGLVGGADLATTVYPFILRGISLIGIDSVNCPLPRRQGLWQHLATDWKPERLGPIATLITLPQLSEKIDAILSGQIVGRVVVQVRNGWPN